MTNKIKSLAKSDSKLKNMFWEHFQVMSNQNIQNMEAVVGCGIPTKKLTGTTLDCHDQTTKHIALLGKLHFIKEIIVRTPITTLLSKIINSFKHQLLLSIGWCLLYLYKRCRKEQIKLPTTNSILSNIHLFTKKNCYRFLKVKELNIYEAGLLNLGSVDP